MPEPDPQPDQQGNGAGGRALAMDDPLLLNIVSDQSRLDVSGLDLDVLTGIVAKSQRQLELTGVRDEESGSGHGRKGKGGRGGADKAEEDGERSAPPGAMLRQTTDKPLSRAAAESLCHLSDEPGWPNEVWSFWARSHHLMVQRQQPFLLGSGREPFDVPARVVVDTVSPLDRQRQRVAAYRAGQPVGTVVECVVMRVANHGAFVELGQDIEGFIPTDELSWAARAGHPSHTVSPGDWLRALLTSLPDPPARIEPSVRALIPDPFAAFRAAHPERTTVRRQVRTVTDSHAYLVLADDVDGAIHVSQLDWRRIERASDLLADGMQVDARVLSYDEGRRQVELSRKALFPKPYEAFKRAHHEDDVVIGEIRSATPTHVYVDLGEPGYPVTGVICVREWAHEEITDLSVHAQVGRRSKVKIIKFDDKREQVELSRKGALPRPFLQYKVAHWVGQVVAGTIRNTNRSFAYVDLGHGVQGVIHVSRLAPYRISQPADVVSVGQHVQAQIIEFDDAREQVVLARYA